MTAILGRTGNLVGFTTGRGTTPWNTEMEEALRKIDAMLASSVIAITNTLPSSANEGDLYLVGTSPTDVAAGWANRIARWRESPAGWEAYTPLEGWIVTIVGEATNKVRRYNGTAWVALAVDSGAEPYAGVPAQTSFWRSTAAGVRAWVQLVAADITDLATTLAGYLTKLNPTFTGTLTGPRATLSEFGVLREYVEISTIGALYPTGVTPTRSNYAAAIFDDGSKVYVGASSEVGFVLSGVAKLIATATAVDLGSAVELKQNGTPRITAGGDGRFTSVRASGLAASNTYLTRVDSNGELVASPIKASPGIGIVFEQPAKLLTAGGSLAPDGLSYNAWNPSAMVPRADDTLSNVMRSLGSGWIWNSQRTNALTITDGAEATPYRGRLRAERWFALSLLLVQNTTSATSWFAAGTGDGSPTIPANYLRQGRRVTIRGRLICSSCAADTAPEIAFKLGSTVVWTQAKAFTIASGNEIIIDIDITMFVDSDGNLIILSECDFYAYATGAYRLPRGNTIAAFDTTTAKTIDITLKPSSETEIWVRSLAYIEV